MSAATAAYLFNLREEIFKQPAPEAFKHLQEVLETAFLAYFDALEGWNEN